MRYRDGAAAATACIILTTVVSMAQEPPVNVELVGSWNAPSTVADVWGTPGVAYVGHFGDAGVHILDISNPAAPTVLAHYRVPPNSNDASAQDVKVHNGLMYIGLGSETSNSVEIVDVRDPANPQHLTWVRIQGELSIHNLFYDDGYLYLAGSGSPKLAIVDLTGYDPNNPPALIDQPLYVLNNVGNSMVHDITVQDGRLYASAWDSGLWVYDVSNLAAQPPSFLGSTPGNNTHSCWVTDDNRFVVTGEERSGGGIQVYEIVDQGGSIDLILRDQFAVATTRASSVHNQTIIGHRLYNSWYGIGLQVFDIDPVTGQLSFVASYDTNPGSGGGAWGVYPFNGEDEVLISDLSTGFWILDVLPTMPLNISFPNGVPVTMPPGQPTSILVQIENGSENVVPGSETLIYRVDPNDPWTSAPLEPLGGGQYNANLPPTPCLDDHFELYVTADGDLGATVSAPPGAPAEHFDIFVGTIETVVEDTFETNMGWTVENINLADGAWERGVPAGDGSRGDPTEDFDGSGQCYLTGNRPGNSDVDGGPTQLISPLFDLSSGDAQFSYARWFTNHNHDQDALVVEISNDGGATWIEVERIRDTGGPVGWTLVTFDVSAFVAPTDQMRWRFSVADNPNNSVTEAALDFFRILRPSCDDLVLGDLNCDGRLDGGDIDPFFLALGDPAAYAAQFPKCDPLRGDVNGDGLLNGGDIDPFFELLGGG